MRSQLLALAAVAGEDTGHRTTQLWNALSRAGHHRHYELAPTAGELREWLEQARRLAIRFGELATAGMPEK